MAFRVAVFNSGVLARTAGGPSGYLWHLREGLSETSTEEARVATVSFLSPQGRAAQPDAGKSTGRSNLAGVKHRLRNHWIVRYGRYALPVDDAFRNITFDGFDLVHFHSAADLVRAGGLRRFSQSVALTIHCPELPSGELRYATGYAPKWVKGIARQLDLQALDRADVLIVPSEDALEPLAAWVPHLDRVLARKTVEYCETGIVSCDAGRSPRDGLGCGGSVGPRHPIFGFMGRHIGVKGYDLLMAAAKLLWTKGLDVHVVVAGALEAGGAMPPEDERWIELGRVEPASFLAKIDVLVLPNRATFFDLVLLEALSAGKAAITSATGGNRTVAKRCPGVATFDPVIPTELSKVMQAWWNSSEWICRGLQNQRAFEGYYTHRHFANRYLGMLGRLGR